AVLRTRASHASLRAPNSSREEFADASAVRPPPVKRGPKSATSRPWPTGSPPPGKPRGPTASRIKLDVWLNDPRTRSQAEEELRARGAEGRDVLDQLAKLLPKPSSRCGRQPGKGYRGREPLDGRRDPADHRSRRTPATEAPRGGACGSDGRGS